MSVKVGTSISDFTLSSIFNPSSIPSPLNEVIDERLALSKELLNIIFIFKPSTISLIEPAM